MRKILDVYVDGSHMDKQHNGRLGCGGILVDKSKGGPFGVKIDQFSIELTPEYMKFTFGESDCSNPTAELVAVLMALHTFKKELKGIDEVVFHADYEGVKKWMEGSWQVKKPWLIRIKDDIKDQIRDLGIVHVRYEWVKGHQSSTKLKTDPDAFWNNEVDQLAKGKK